MATKAKKFVGVVGNVQLGSFEQIAQGTVVKLFSAGAAADVITFKIGDWIAWEGKQNIEVSADVVDMEGRDWMVTTRNPIAGTSTLVLTTAAVTSHHVIVLTGGRII